MLIPSILKEPDADSCFATEAPLLLLDPLLSTRIFKAIPRPHLPQSVICSNTCTCSMLL